MNTHPKISTLTAQRRHARDACRPSPPPISNPLAVIPRLSTVDCRLLTSLIPFPKQSYPQPFLRCGLLTRKLTKLRLTFSETKAKLPHPLRLPSPGVATLPEFPMSDTLTLPSPAIADSQFFDALKRYWSYADFRPRQEEIVRALASGRAVGAVMPTGGGKSLCYQ